MRDAEGVAAAIRRLSIRGAPLIGVAAAYGVALELARDPGGLERACATLAAARPTAVNLGWAVDRMRSAVAAQASAGADRAAVALNEARAIETEETAASGAMGTHGADWLLATVTRRSHAARTQPEAPTLRILTHCNAGALAAPGRGTALAVVGELNDRGALASVLTAESRPLLQGARLTVYELARAGIAHELIVDGAGAGLIAAGEVDAVVVGCDRVAANGDVANKVGTYAHALAAAAAGIPFLVAGPTSTIDRHCPSGAEIVIEQRPAAEVVGVIAGPDGALATVVPDATPVRNPAFDVTPASLISALATERGVVSPAAGDSVVQLLGT